MAKTVLARKDNDLKLRYALKDQAGAWIDLSGATLTGYLLRPTSGITTHDSVSVIGSPVDYNVEIVFGKAKLVDAGNHKAQVKIVFPDTTVRHSEIDMFPVAENLA